MSQKFISLDDAAAQLGVSKDQLNQLREAGDLRAYRDGASWKFRTEEIDRLEQDGMPVGGDTAEDFTLDLGSELSLGDPDPPEVAEEAPKTDSGEKADDEDDIGLGVEPLGDGDDAESILLTGDDELEGGLPRPQSTIIGKSELSLEDDLQLAAGSDAPVADPASASGSFAGLEELELDLDDSSDKVAPAPEAAKPADAASSDLELEELELDLSGSAVGGSDVGVGDGKPDASAAGSIAGLSGIDDVNLSEDEDDDLVLGGSDDDDFGAAGGSDSGINLAPSDSGFALDEVPLDLGGSAIGSALDLASLSAASAVGSSPSNLDSAAGDFQLTPDDPSEEEDSSQIVAFDEVSEDEEEEDLAGFEPSDDADDDVSFGDGLSSDLGAAPGAAPVAVSAAAVQEVPFPGWVIGLLACGFFSMLLAGVMAMDLLQSMWAWEEPYSVSSAVMDGLLSLVGG